MTELTSVVGVISAATALVASVTGPLVTFHVGRSQVRATVLSANRQRWIDGFRDLIAEFCSQVVVVVQVLPGCRSTCPTSGPTRPSSPSSPSDPQLHTPTLRLVTRMLGWPLPVVRVAWNEPATIMKALDLGAMCIIVPLVNTAAEAAMAVSACRYPPIGMRSSGPVRAVHYGGADYQANANDEIVVMAMIETKEGIENLDAICATPGLGGVYIGPADLSFALGWPTRR